LLWLHEQEIIRLNRGLSVFRSAMTIRLGDDWKKQFQQPDFEPLNLHYKEQVTQIHVMAEYVKLGLEKMADALHLTMDYFSLKQEDFLRRWLPGREKELERQTTPESWQKIVEALGAKDQRDIVADDRETLNMLVLAGPGSGKTRVLVHRIAYLVRVKRENPRGIVALAYNRHAAAQIRQRLYALIGDDARGVTVLTLHALAMRLVGASFADRASTSDDDFKKILLDATALLRGDGLPPEEADMLRDRLLAGFRWILVDEYQDIGQEEYDLISALAGRAQTDEDGKINLFAVGDDDQNIYGFKGASTGFIRRFETDYQAKPFYLIDNYRSSAHIIAATNALIAPATGRMKISHPIRINKKREKYPPGGDWQARDTVAQGRVQILPAGDNLLSQAIAVMAELERLAARDTNWNWASCAVIAREWALLNPVRSYCEWRDIPVQFAKEGCLPFWKLRETQALLEWLKQSGQNLIDAQRINDFLADKSANPSWEMLRAAVSEYALETEKTELPLAHFMDWLAEWGREARRHQTGLLLVTAHSAKGLEFDHVAVLDGGWQAGSGEDMDAVRRLYYVAMTRARQTLTLARMCNGNVLLDTLPESPCLLRRPVTRLAEPPPELARQYTHPDLTKINLGYAGRFSPADPIHQRIAHLDASSLLKLHEEKGNWYLLDECGKRVGKMSGKFSVPPDMRCIEAQVNAILAWRNDEADTAKYGESKCEQWEVIVPELVFSRLSAVD
jgi:ATP-dependent DNA helicase RecQ